MAVDVTGGLSSVVSATDSLMGQVNRVCLGTKSGVDYVIRGQIDRMFAGAGNHDFGGK
jgi:hypothetical protein